jgi:ADP-ribose 1''-phosphate phosphatase
MISSMKGKMSNITYIKGDLFSAPKGSVLIHAVNTQGVWGGGIAKEFKKRFPYSYGEYRKACMQLNHRLLGACLIVTNDEGYDIACLFTSNGYGQLTDSEESILNATKRSVFELCEATQGKELHACKFNSGLFRVPWEKTEAILLETGKKFTIYEY